MNPYRALLDEHRQTFTEYRAHVRAIEAAGGDARKVDFGLLARSIAAQAPMLEHKAHRLARREDIGRVLAAVADAHDRDAAALAAVLRFELPTTEPEEAADAVAR